MRAIQVTSLGGPGAVRLADITEPAAQPGLLLIDVHAAGVTNADLLHTRGRHQIKPPLPFVLGSEIAGVVRSAPGGRGFAHGDRVAAFVGFGGYGEVVAIDPRLVFPLPDTMSFTVGAGVPANLLTAHLALTRRGKLRPGETVLVHGAAGGVGIASTRLAKALGATVFGVTSTEERAELARRAGADEVVLVDSFGAAVKRLTGGRGVDIVVDPVGGDRFPDSLRSLAPEGRLLVVGFAGGRVPTVDASQLLPNNVSVCGVAWGEVSLTPGRSDSAAGTNYPRQQWEELLPLLATGVLDPLVGGTYPLERAADALAAVENRAAVGKLILEVVAH